MENLKTSNQDISKFKFSKEINIKNFNSIDELAKKLRTEQFDMNELRKIKEEALINQNIKSKRKNSAIRIQALLRGYFLRKKFKVYM
jgi:hypothetical protein